MEIQQVLTGRPVSFSSRQPLQAEKKTASETSTDRLELKRQWVRQMDEQRTRLRAALLSGEDRKKDIGGILDYMETEEDKLDALSEQLKVQQKCLIIAMRIMRGKKVPPQDEMYLMEHDPEGYKLAMALRRPPKKDEKECESVLDDEDKKETSDSGEAAPVESSGGGEAPAVSDSGETTE